MKVIPGSREVKKITSRLMQGLTLTFLIEPAKRSFDKPVHKFSLPLFTPHLISADFKPRIYVDTWKFLHRTAQNANFLKSSSNMYTEKSIKNNITCCKSESSLNTLFEKQSLQLAQKRAALKVLKLLQEIKSQIKNIFFYYPWIK